MIVIRLDRDDYFVCLEGLTCMWDGTLVNDSESRRIILDVASVRSERRAMERGEIGALVEHIDSVRRVSFDR